MKIIDSNTDFYDFYQNIYRDDHLTFDRRDSYPLSLEEFASHFVYDNRKYRYFTPSDKRYVLLQVCNTFWFFEFTILKYDDTGKCLDYDLTLIETWKDYNYKPEIIKLSHIKFNYLMKKENENRIEAIKMKDYKTVKVFNEFDLIKSHGKNIEKEERHIPILKDIGIPGLVDPLDIYLAIEEYLSKQIEDSERTESIGLSNNEKIENHGFNLKDSFRGKNT